MNFTIGLTGGIGSGKSLAASYFRALGAYVIRADDIAKQLLQPNGSCYQAVIEYFGDDILDSSGVIQRKQLASYIFGDDKKKQWLEQLLHPKIRQAIDVERRSITHTYVIIEIPLLYSARQKGQYTFLNRTLVITCPNEIRIKRIMQRDAISRISAEQILAQQVNQKVLLTIADDIIDNQDSTEKLKQAIAKHHRQYCLQKNTS